jgi:hypothetical protein
LRAFLDSGGLNLDINKTGPRGRSEASRAIFDFSGLLCHLPRGQFAKPLFAGSNPAATSKLSQPGGLRRPARIEPPHGWPLLEIC